MTKQRQNLIQSIANIISDYRQGEMYAIDQDHVDTWARQFSEFGFDEAGQVIILGEIQRILESYYVCRSFAQSFLAKILTSQKLIGVNPMTKIRNTQFLKIQRKGNSQNDLLDLCEPILQSHYGLSVADCGNSPTTYIYLDDCLYSGNTAWRGIEQWIPNAVRGTTLHLIFCGAKYLRIGVYKDEKRRKWRIYPSALNAGQIP